MSPPRDYTLSSERSMDLKSLSLSSDEGLALADSLRPSASCKAIASCSWARLFSFTKKAHAGILLSALVATALIASLKTLLSVFLGRIFNAITQLGDGSRPGQFALEEVSKWCFILVGLGLGNWMAHTSFLSLWTVFGELQANEVRKEVTSSLLSKHVEWFGHLGGGIKGLHIRIHT